MAGCRAAVKLSPTTSAPAAFQARQASARVRPSRVSSSWCMAKVTTTGLSSAGGSLPAHERLAGPPQVLGDE